MDFSLLDVPRDAPPEDAEAYLRAAIAWHFGEDTGSPFWLRAAEEPRLRPADRRPDLRRPAHGFPTWSTNCAASQSKTSSPAATAHPLPIPRIFESGGTTGAPKRTAQLPDWVEQVTRWQVEDFTAGGFVPGAGCSA